MEPVTYSALAASLETVRRDLETLLVGGEGGSPSRIPVDSEKEKKARIETIRLLLEIGDLFPDAADELGESRNEEIELALEEGEALEREGS